MVIRITVASMRVAQTHGSGRGDSNGLHLVRIDQAGTR